MIEIKLELDNIDYATVVSFVFPFLQSAAQKSTALWATVVKNMSSPDEDTVRGVLKLLPQNMKDKLAVELFERYKGELPDMLTAFAETKGISLRVDGVEILHK